MVRNFARSGAAISVLAQLNATLEVINLGTVSSSSLDNARDERIRGHGQFSRQPA
jgi:hypothetical protein